MFAAMTNQGSSQLASTEVDEDVPVLIVGGGGAGLTASMLLGGLGVETLLVSALPTTSDLPKAHVLNQRTMEILEDVGVADEIERHSTPAAEHGGDGVLRGFAGPAEGYGRRLLRLESWGAGGADENWAAASACRQQNLPQIRLEPLLKQRAEEISPGAVRFGHELVDLQQHEEYVVARIRERDSGREYSVRCAYVVGADGGRSIPQMVGVGYEGLGKLTNTATVHASADFSPWATDPDVLIRWILSPQVGAGVVMVPMGPTRWGPDSEEWVIHLNYPRRSPCTIRRAGRGRRAHGHRPPGRRDGDPPDHPLVGRSRAGGEVPRRPCVPRRRRRAPAPADRRARADQRNPGRPQPLLEARARSRGTRVPATCSTATKRSGGSSDQRNANARWRTR